MARRWSCVSLLSLFVWCAGALAAAAQTPVQASGGDIPRLRVFLDCGDCFAEYLRDEIEWVDFVRQPQDADIHVLSSRTGTGGGGSEVVLRFVGKGRFQSVDQDLKVLSVAADTEELRRRRVLRTVIIGLGSYLARDGRAGDLAVSVRTADTPMAVSGGVVRDPWNKWFFSIRGGGSIDAQESNREWNWNASASADRVTDQWILSFGVRGSENHERFNLDEDDEDEAPLEVVRRERNFDWFAAKSLGPHWSVGFLGEIESSTFGNRRFNVQSGPAIEYSIFPYTEYASRRFTIQYAAGSQYARYHEITLFDKLRETHPIHELSVTLEQEQPWGSVQLGTQWTQFLHDRSKYRLEVDGELSFRITRGLSLELDGSASRIRDQIHLPKRGATPEEVLLRLRELASGYSTDFSISMTYSFGSIFNNVVNPRFGR